MIIVLISLLIVIIIVAVAGYNDSTSSKTLKKWIGYGCLWLSITSACLVFMCWSSYNTYLRARTFYSATVEQYASAVEIYGDKAVIDIKAAAWTDLKYQGYQTNIATFIKNLRGEIINYNTLIIGKRIMKASSIFNWLIVAPDDDMKIIKMKAALKGN